MPPLNGYGLVEINAIVAYSFIDKLLGGDGSVPEEVRHFTDVELAIVRKIIDTMLLDLSDTWKTVLNVSFNPKEIQTNPAMVRIIPMKEVTVIITFSVKVADSSGLITICIPYANLEPIAFKLGNQQWHKYAAKQSEEIQAAHMNNFHNVPLDVTAILGKMDLPMEEVLALQAGDILDLGSKTSDPVTVRIASKDKYYANPGLLSKHKAVSILKEVEKE
jgi:flagellar motor switch protein FliM